MPEEDKTAFDAKKFEAFLRDKWGPDRKCPYCGATNWFISPTCGSLDEYVAGDQRPQKAMPVVPVICGNCGSIALVHPLKSGALERPAKKEVSNAQ